MHETATNIILSSLSKEYQTVANISLKVGLTVAKTSALLRILVQKERVEMTDIKVPKKGLIKGYRLKGAE